MHRVSFRKVDVDGFNIFYREAGSRHAPAILLLHGFPSAGHMFRHLIPQLADRFYVIAPDLPGFGQSDMPDRGKRSRWRNSAALRASSISREAPAVGTDRPNMFWPQRWLPANELALVPRLSSRI